VEDGHEAFHLNNEEWGGLSRALIVSVLLSTPDAQEYASYIDVFDMVTTPVQTPLLRTDSEVIVGW
jgi:hypothetical protein